MITYAFLVLIGSLSGSFLTIVLPHRWKMRRRNIDGLRADRVWLFAQGWSLPDDQQRDKIRLDLATRYVRQNWWWTTRVRVFTEDIEERRAARISHVDCEGPLLDKPGAEELGA